MSDDETDCYYCFSPKKNPGVYRDIRFHPGHAMAQRIRLCDGCYLHLDNAIALHMKDSAVSAHRLMEIRLRCTCAVGSCVPCGAAPAPDEMEWYSGGSR